MAMDGIKVTLDFNKRSFARLAVLTEEMSKRTAQGIGTIYVRYIAANTPPNAFRGRVKESLSNRKNEAIVGLQKKIAQNLAGVDSVAELKPNAEPAFYDNKHGALYAPGTKEPAARMGMFGMFIPTTWRSPRRGFKIPRSTPEAAYATAYWDGKQMLPRQWSVHLVRKSDLSRFIKKKQAHVGKLISGWAPAARVFATGKGIATGFFENLGGKGFGRMYKNKLGQWSGIAINRQSYSEEQRAHLQAMANVSAKRTVEARKTQLAAIKRWYTNEAKRILK